MPLFRSLPASATNPLLEVVEPQSPVAVRGDGAIARQAVRELWLALHLPRSMLDALGNAIAALSANTAVTVVTATTDADVVATEKAKQALSAARIETSRKKEIHGRPNESVAVIDLDRDSKVVCDCNPVASAAGIAPGMALNSALALSPQLHTLARDSRRERWLLQTLAEWSLLHFTPRVSLEPPDAILLEIHGSLRLFGGVRRLCDQLCTQLRAAGLEVSLSLMPSPLAALWMARAGQSAMIRNRVELASRLATLPLSVTRWPERSLETLATMGVRTVGDCLRLPRDGFARRFEPRLLDMLDRAVGRRPDPRDGFIPRERFAAGRDLEPEIAETERLDAAFTPLLDELCGFLRKRRCGVQALELRLVHRETSPTRLHLRFVEPVADTARIAVLLRERLAQLVLPAPVRALHLRSGPLEESREASAELFAMDRRQSGAGVPQLVERLRARLGAEAVYGLCLVPEHRPEAAWRVAEPALPTAKTRNRDRHPKPKCAPASAEGKPLWLLAEPQLLDGGDQPCFEGMLELESGPERIESGWWDGRDVRRDYYVARNPAGVRLWVFRDREPSGRWFLHGVFG